MQKRGPSMIHRLPTALMAAGLLCVLSTAAQGIAADRTTSFVPQPSSAVGKALPRGVLANQAYGADVDGWNAYMRVWQAHHSDPSDVGIRRYLGLPLNGVVDAEPRRGRSAPGWLGWNAGSYRQVMTPHFTIYTRAQATDSKMVAQDLERCYWVWTQMFFPLWEGSAQVQTNLRQLASSDSVSDYLKRRSARITVRRKLRVVLFRDAAEYQRTLGREVPGIERSTGYYNDQNQTIFLYAAKVDEAATRRHEMVHQLFREATRSGLGRNLPAERSGFWLVEGIAGYFESLKVGSRIATVGGWDSPRLQFARFRMLALGDVMPMGELQADGRVAAQKRNDLARWYAHAIAQTHHLMDGGDSEQRQWLYHQIAQTYMVGGDLPEGALAAAPERGLTKFLRIDDAHLDNNPAPLGPTSLCLAGCEVTSTGLATIPPATAIDWLDLSRVPIDNTDVERLAPQPRSIERLSLEATRIDSGLRDWLAKAVNLRELDLSSTRIDDSVVGAIRAGGLEVLYLTGSKNVTDKSIAAISRLQNLESVDLQRTGMTANGISQLRRLRPRLTINPLEIRAQ